MSEQWVVLAQEEMELYGPFLTRPHAVVWAAKEAVKAGDLTVEDDDFELAAIISDAIHPTKINDFVLAKLYGDGLMEVGWLVFELKSPAVRPTDVARWATT